MGQPRIFVTIASYRDAECQWTVKDLFDKAADPDRVFVGLCCQTVPEDDPQCIAGTTRPDQCRVIEVDARHSLGACWARSQTQSLWRGEEYTFQIDSHMRFVPRWDEVLIDMLARCPSPKPVLSAYPASYVPPDKLGEPMVSVLRANEFDLQGMLRIGSVGLSSKEFPAELKPNPFIAAGMLFAPSQIIVDVPYDPHVYFLGEEITLAVRLWTHGWDIFTPTDNIAYHYYDRHVEPRHWSDQKDAGAQITASYRRVRHLLGTETTDDPDVLRDIEGYGIGTQRSLAEYEAFAGIDFRHQLIGGKSMPEVEAELAPNVRRERTSRYFSMVYRRRTNDAKRLAEAQAVKAALPRVLAFLGIRTMVDAGCGLSDWLDDIIPGLNVYLGYDIAPEVIADGRKRSAGRLNVVFNEADITVDTLPSCDAILCRDVLSYMPLPMVTETLTRFKASGPRYLISTTYTYGLNQMVRIGGKQPIDLCAPPFNLPKPVLAIPESESGGRKSLGIWSLADLP